MRALLDAAVRAPRLMGYGSESAHRLAVLHHWPDKTVRRPLPPVMALGEWRWASGARAIVQHTAEGAREAMVSTWPLAGLRHTPSTYRPPSEPWILVATRNTAICENPTCLVRGSRTRSDYHARANRATRVLPNGWCIYSALFFYFAPSRLSLNAFTLHCPSANGFSATGEAPSEPAYDCGSPVSAAACGGPSWSCPSLPSSLSRARPR